MGFHLTDGRILIKKISKSKKNVKFYTITNEEETSNSYNYVTGLNIDPPGFGLREFMGNNFTDSRITFCREDILAFLPQGIWIREVTLPKEAKIYKFKGSPKGWRADRIILGERRRIDINVIRQLIDEGADVHADNDYALHFACFSGQLELVKLLLHCGADIHANDDCDDGGALQWASTYGHIEIVRLLIDSGADVNANGDYALRCALGNDKFEVAKFLLDHGANVNTALIRASADGQLEVGELEVVKYLLDHGADIHADNDAALRSASYQGHLEIVKILLDHGADIHAYNDGALLLASFDGHLNVVQYLLDHGGVLSSFLCKIFIGQFFEERQVLTHFSYRV